MRFDIFHFSIKYHQILWSLINILRKFLRKSTQVIILPSNLIIYILLFAFRHLEIWWIVNCIFLQAFWCLHVIFYSYNLLFLQFAGWPGGGNGGYYTHHACFVLKRTGSGGSTSSCKTKYLPCNQQIVRTTRRLLRRSLRLPTRRKWAQSGYLCTTPSTAQAGADAGISWS